jgi:amino-acid N-acetyltransferase
VRMQLTVWKIPSWPKRRRRYRCIHNEGARYFATDRASKSQLREELAREHVKDLSKKQKTKKEARAIDKVWIVCQNSSCIANLISRTFSSLS